MEAEHSPGHSKQARQRQAALTLRNIWSFLESYIPLANTHGADFITQQHWERHLPEPWRQELVSLTRPQLVLLSQYGLDPGSSTPATRQPGQPHPATTQEARDKDDGSQLSSFITAAARCRLENTSTLSTISDIVDSTERIDAFKKENNNLSHVIREGMSEKKSHEIEAISSAVMSVVSQSHAEIIMDVGSGKGYLGCELSLRQRLPVIGLDSCNANTQGASTRDQKLTQRWQKMTHSRDTKLRNAGNRSRRVADVSKSSHQNTTVMPDCPVTGSWPVEMSNQVSCISTDRHAGVVSDTPRTLMSPPQSCGLIEALTVDVPSVEGETCASSCLDLSKASLGDTVGNSCATSSRSVSDCKRASADGRSCGKASVWSCSCERLPTQNGTSRHDCGHSQLGCVNLSVDSLRYVVSAVPPASEGQHSSRQVVSAMPPASEGEQSSRHVVSAVPPASEGEHSSRHVVSAVPPASEGEHRGDQKPDPAVAMSNRSLYIPLTVAVHPDMNLSQIMEDHACQVGITQPASARILCTGLHACGSLSVTAMRLFVHNPAVVGLCVVGCCYQLMEEACLEAVHEVSSQSPEAHFPLSEVGKQLGLHLGRNARNLASQSVDRLQQSGQLQGADFQWRAMLELLLQELEVTVPERIVGMRKLHKRSRSFLEYVRSSLSKLRLDPDLASPELVASVEDRCQGTEDKMAAFVQVKLVLAPVIEALVLLDRYLYLLQQDSIRDAHIVQLFDPVISPRCYAILAWKLDSLTPHDDIST